MTAAANKKIAPSILSCDFSRLGEEVRALEAAGADWIHVDVMDGMFVPNLSIGVPVVASLRKITALPLDVHLMVQEPLRYVQAFADAGADRISVHVEACTHLDRTVKAIKDLGKSAGVALNPATPLTFLDHIYTAVDLILVMSVNPGFGGQSFVASSLEKIRELKKKLQKLNQVVPIEVDGGITLDNIAEVSKAGADVFVAGAAIFGSKDYAATITAMKQKIAD